MYIIYRLSIVGLMLVILASCVAVRSFPYTVRAGDTVTLAIGSLDGVNKNNITVSFYSDTDPSNPLDLTSNVRSVLRLFPDKTSESYWDETTGFGTQTMTYINALSGHGPWLSVLVLDLPPTIQPGTGYLKIIPGQGTIYPNLIKKVADVNVGLEILAINSGSSALGDNHSFDYTEADFSSNVIVGDLTKLEQSKQVVVRTLPTTTVSYPSISAAEYVIDITAVDQGGNSVIDLLTEDDLAVVLDDQPGYVKNQTNLSWSKLSNLVKVNIVSIRGNQNPRFIRFSILLSNLVLKSSNGYSLGNAASIVSSKYYDANGELMTGPLPEVVILN